MATNAITPPAARENLPPKLVKEARMQFAKYNHSDLAGFTWTHERSTFTGAKRDLVVYDETGKIAFVGREFSDKTFFWVPDFVGASIATV